MRKRFVVVAVVAGAVAAPSLAQAEVTGPPEAIEMVALMAVPKPPNAQIAFEACPVDDEFTDGCSFSDGRVYVEPVPGYESRDLRLNLYHELGHRYWDDAMARDDHRAFRRITRMTRRWHTAELVGERFAEEYTNCAITAMPGSWRFVDGYGLEPTRAVHLKVCALISR